VRILPLCSIYPSDFIPLAGATAAAHFLTDTGLFQGQSRAFFTFLFGLADAADRAVRECGAIRAALRQTGKASKITRAGRAPVPPSSALAFPPAIRNLITPWFANQLVSLVPGRMTSSFPGSGQSSVSLPEFRGLAVILHRPFRVVSVVVAQLLVGVG